MGSISGSSGSLLEEFVSRGTADRNLPGEPVLWAENFTTLGRPVLQGDTYSQTHPFGICQRAARRRDILRSDPYGLEECYFGF